MENQIILRMNQDGVGKTNADRIRAMSDKELAGVIMCPMEFTGLKDLCAKNPGHTCVECSLRWLQEPVKEDPHG